MNINYLINYGNKVIDKDVNKILISYLFNIKPIEISFNKDKIVTEELFNKYKILLNRLINGEPIQYVINNTCFYGFDYYVDKRVLIPRRETEELVENCIYYINKYFNKNIKVLDLCSGSGCIGITLKKIINSLDVTLSDISKDCNDVERINSINNNCFVNIVNSDLFNNINDKFDVIICNPPYIRNDEEIMDIVYNNEPHLALFGGVDGLDFYKMIHDKYINYVNDNYLIAFEIGDMQKEDIINLFCDKDVKILTKKDLMNKDRMVFILKINE